MLTPPLVTFPPAVLFSLSELPLAFVVACSLLVAAAFVGAALGVPFRAELAAVAAEAEATDGGRRTEAADPGRREAVGVRVTVVRGAVLSRRLVTGGEGRGGMVAGLGVTADALPAMCGVEG